ncbi:hypothetical protein KCU65_g3012, partial [Aureobasidium melanogenum]
MLTIRQPFRSLSSDNSLSQGGAGCVYATTRNIAFKCPIMFEDINQDNYSRAWMKQNIERLEKEKQVYKVLNLHPHPHLLQSILCTPEGIFMPRLETTLAARLASETTPSLELQERWIRQLVSAAAWLEKLGYAHGDLRPHNILLDRFSNIVVADFDGTVPIGEELKLATPPFCKVDEKNDTPPAGPETEQFSLGSCIYNIRFGFPPFSDLKLESPVWRLKLVRKEFPPTSNDVYGSIIQDCWHGVFPSISALQTEILKISDPKSKSELQSTPRRTTTPYLRSWFLLAQCQEYVAEQRLRLEGSFARKIQLRYQLLLWSVARFGLSVFCGGEPSTV